MLPTMRHRAGGRPIEVRPVEAGGGRQRRTHHPAQRRFYRATGRDACPGRRLRFRQVDLLGLLAGLDTPIQRHRAARRHRHLRPRRGRPRRLPQGQAGLRVPVLPAAGAPECAGKRDAAAGTARRHRRARQGRGDAGPGRPVEPPAPLSEIPVRRRAAARGAGARLRHRAAAAVRRRADRQPRCRHRRGGDPADVRTEPRTRLDPGAGHPRSGDGGALRAHHHDCGRPPGATLPRVVCPSIRHAAR
jgi:hypothetical protein